MTLFNKIQRIERKLHPIQS